MTSCLDNCVWDRIKWIFLSAPLFFSNHLFQTKICFTLYNSAHSFVWKHWRAGTWEFWLYSLSYDSSYGHLTNYPKEYALFIDSRHWWSDQTLPLSSRLYYYRARRFIFSRGKNVGSASLHSTVGQILLENILGMKYKKLE